MKDKKKYDHTQDDYVKALGHTKEELMLSIEPAVKMYITGGQPMSKAILHAVESLKASSSARITKDDIAVKSFLVGMLFEHVIASIKKTESLIGGIFGGMTGSPGSKPGLGLLGKMLGGPEKLDGIIGQALDNVFKRYKDKAAGVVSEEDSEPKQPFNYDDLIASVKSDS